jgi:chromosomal replication initiator protein
VAEKYPFPKGLVIKRTAGGPNILKRVLLDLRRYAFSGYVRVSLTKDDVGSVGRIVVEEGVPTISVYEKEDRKEFGKVALMAIWKESFAPRTSIEVHAKVELAGIIQDLPGTASIEGLSPKPKEAEVAGEDRPEEEELPVEEPKPEEGEVPADDVPADDVPADDVPVDDAPVDDAPVEEAPVDDVPVDEVPVDEVPMDEGGEAPGVAPEAAPVEEEEEPVDEIERIGTHLTEWKNDGYNVEPLEKAMSEGLEPAKEAFENLREGIKKLEFLSGILIGMDKTGFEERAERIRAKLFNPDFILAVEAELEDLRIRIDRRKRLETEVIPMKKREEAPSGAVDQESNLILQYTFDNFVVGQSNKFPWGAARAVATTIAMEEPSTLYNPLFIWSGPGLGKTHLINALGNYIKDVNPGAKVLYTSGEKFGSEFAEATERNELKELRERYGSLDAILIDDIQFLAGNDKAQEELFNTFNTLYNENKQIAFASDRLPREIPTIQDRLVSRFESGLVADIQQPEFDTRLRILEMRAEENKLKIDKDVLEFIANVVTDNIRELEGAFNKVVAYSNLMGRPLHLELARDVLKDMIEEEIRFEPKKVSRTLVPGGSYLIEEEKPEKCFGVFIRGIVEGYEPMMITRFNPKRMRSRYELENCRILWLTDKESETEETVAPVLESMVSIIEDFMKGKRGLVLIDGIEYLISMNSFDAVIRFLRSVIDEVSESDGAFILSASPKTMKEWEIKILEKEMEILEVDKDEAVGGLN